MTKLKKRPEFVAARRSSIDDADPPRLFRAIHSLEDGLVGDGVMLLLELERGQVVQAAVKSDGIEVKAPGYDDDFGLGARAEPLDAQALVAERAVEARP